MMSSDPSSMTVDELKTELRALGLPVSGRKADLVVRLEASHQGLDAAQEVEDAHEDIKAHLEPEPRAEEQGASFEAILRRLSDVLPVDPAVALGIVGLLLVAGAVSAVISVTSMRSVDYDLITFEPEQARAHAEALVALGHPEWEGRLSGTGEEGAAADLVIGNLTSWGYLAQRHEFDVPMFAVESEPSLSVCEPPLGIGVVLTCSTGAGATITPYEHRTEFVIQGYSGRQSINYGEDVEVIDLGNGSESAPWIQAADGVGVVTGGGGVGSNTDLYIRATTNGLRALITVNTNQNCDQIRPGDCVPIFKTIDVEAVKAANSGLMPESTAFLQVSNLTGMDLLDRIEAGGRLALDVQVDNAGERVVRTPCGEMEGSGDEVIIIGAHHDTVYHAQGAVDDTSGTATVLELAYQFSLLEQELGRPEVSIRFCTWGGEEEGLWGSSAYVNRFGDELATDLRLYVNFDMNHVDADTSRGNDLSFWTNSEADHTASLEIWDSMVAEDSTLEQRYDVRFGLYPGAEGATNALAANSDHAPFAYELPSGVMGAVAGVYGSGSVEYHTYADTMDRFNEDSLEVSAVLYGTLIRSIAWP